MARSADPRTKLASQRGVKRTGPIGSILPGDDAEVARDIQRIWLEITKLKPFPPGVKPARIRSLITVTDDYTAKYWDTVLANGTFTVTLPEVDTPVANRAKEIVIKNSGSGLITVAQFGSETIDGSTTNLRLAAEESVWLVANISGWWVIARSSRERNLVVVTSAYTARTWETVLANGTFTVTLPTAIDNKGDEVVVKNSGSGVITVAQAGSQTIDGSTANVPLAAKESIWLVANVSGWWVL